jgi:hypothetical protein
MAFCTNCGTNVTGAFCQQCGKPAGAASPAAAAAPPEPPQPAAPPPFAGTPDYASPGYAAPAAPPKRKTSPLVWVLVIVLGLFVAGGIAVVGAGLFVVHKAKQAGLDPDLIQKNPGLAVSKMVVAANPDLEVLDANERRGTITVREKSTGKEFTLNFEDIKQGKFSMKEGGMGKGATFEFGSGGSKLPQWIPTYPGSKLEGTFAGSSGEGSGGMGNFNTKDSPAQVISYYQDQLRSAGFKITTTASTEESSMLTAEDEGTKRTLSVTVSKGSEGTTANLIFGVKR